MLVHLRARAVDADRSGRPVGAGAAERAAMSAASWTMRDPRRWAAAQRLVTAGRVLGRRGRIAALPWPLSRWTTSRDAPTPPAETFRQWWARERGGRR
jgi:L-lactate dehydrogenase complex protein LldF